jgi:hypothetical protein
MKKIVLLLLLFVSVISCNNKESKDPDKEATESKVDSKKYACPMHPEVTGKEGAKCSKCGMELTEPVTPSTSNDTITKTESTDSATSKDFANDIIICYINLKNALVKDDSKMAAEKGKTLLAAFNRFDTNSLNPKQKEAFLDIADEAKENAEHIGDNAGKIDHQREHFVLLSKDINDLIKIFGSNRQLYQDYCPMANDSKGAIWISEAKEIQNPYQGSKMLTCGTIKKTY